MTYRQVPIVLIFLFAISCTKNDPPDFAVVHNDQHIWVVTQHNDNTRCGYNPQEMKLTTTNVNAKTFGKLFSLSVDDQVYSQPLIAGSLSISNGKHNVVFIATVRNSVYAFDADNGRPYWKKNYTAAGMRPTKNTDMTGACGGHYKDFSGNIGIVGTPVIDSITKTIYFVSRSTNGADYVQYLHAVNILNGAEMPGSPVKITATYAGTGSGTVNNLITFDAQIQNQRQALTLVNGIVYVSFSSHCDWGPYHGWILGYNASTLQQQIVYNDTPNGYAGGIWESGNGLAADSLGNLYAVVGNGSVGTNNNPADLINRGESALKLAPSPSSLLVKSFFTPSNYQHLEDNDLDYGCMGGFLIPSSNYFFTGCKDGSIYLLNKDNMGGFSSSSNSVQQIVKLSAYARLRCQPAYYKGSSGEFVFLWSENDNLRAYPFRRTTNLLDVTNATVSSAPGPTGGSGALLSVSSNGVENGTGIVWASYASSGNANQEVRPGILRAFDAQNITNELWNNDENIEDQSGTYAKFSSPTIANGHVYLATFSNQVIVYGLK